MSMFTGSSGFLKDSASKVRFRLMAFTRAICLREHVKTPIVLDVGYIRASAHVPLLALRLVNICIVKARLHLISHRVSRHATRISSGFTGHVSV